MLEDRLLGVCSYLREAFFQKVKLIGTTETINQSLIAHLTLTDQRDSFKQEF